MNCLSDTALERWLGGELSPVEERAVDLHLEVCLPCRLVAHEHRETRIAGATRANPKRTLLALINLAPHAGGNGSLGTAQAAGASPQFAYIEEAPQGAHRLAADSTDPSSGVRIPAFSAEGGKLVVHFQVEEPSRAITAHLVSQSVEEIRFRPLVMGDRVFVADADGLVRLNGICPVDAIGLRVEVPSLVAEWALDAAFLGSADVNPPHPLPVAAASRGEPGSVGGVCQLVQAAPGFEITLLFDPRIHASPSQTQGSLGVVAVSCANPPSFAFLDAKGMATLAVGLFHPECLRVALFRFTGRMA